MQSHLNKNHQSNKVEALNKTKAAASQDFEDQIKKTLASNASKGTKGTILFLDKPYIPGEFEQVTNFIDNNKKSDSVKKCALTP